jgi:hypothetical protein
MSSSKYTTRHFISICAHSLTSLAVWQVMNLKGLAKKDQDALVAQFNSTVCPLALPCGSSRLVLLFCRAGEGGRPHCVAEGREREQSQKAAQYHRQKGIKRSQSPAQQTLLTISSACYNSSELMTFFSFEPLPNGRAATVRRGSYNKKLEMHMVKQVRAEGLAVQQLWT